MGDLIIVESPAKVKTISKFLGQGYDVQASIGHVRDLPQHSLGVDEEHDFSPKYEIVDAKKNVVNTLKTAAAKADTIYLAPDPDREGEAIAWHIASLLSDQGKAIKRIEFNEITAKAVKNALAHPRELNKDLFDAQQARRVLDRLVGYKISPLLWKTVKRGISAGRVQSVTLRLIVDREHEREIFTSEEYWLFKALLSTGTPPAFFVQLQKIKDKKAVIRNKEEADALSAKLANHDFLVSRVEKKKRERHPAPPFITSTLQQAANQRFSYTSKRTMSIAQKLYEGVEIEDKGLKALITYMRTDSTRIADEAQSACRQFIDEKFGESFLPKKKRIYKTKNAAQDAHEAIRPVDVTLTPDQLKTSLTSEQYNLYSLIWTRFVASQMASAEVEDTVVLTTCLDTLWRAHGERVLFPGFLTIMPKTASKEEAVDLPNLTEGEVARVLEMQKEQKFTQPPARFSEASLVKELEENGIGRPSTYASIISTLLDRNYVELKEKHLIPTDLGRVVCSQLTENFSQLMDVGFTAQMEGNLDKIAAGDENWVNIMHNFADTFNPTLDAASKNMKSVKQGMESGLLCPNCHKPLFIKFGKAGSFLGCSDYPTCRFTSDFVRTENGSIQLVERTQPEKVGQCPQCGKDLVVKTARTGSHFIACTGYPDCSYAKPYSTGVTCPRCGKGELVERSSKRGKIFYSCSTYPQCDFALWSKPLPEECPVCGSPYLVEKKSKGGLTISCPEKNCHYVKEENS
ncbi:MAG: type I DNA topoisomerase [Desulfovibrio sp.]|nr:type I DNA topoisomerase [Desulfovibrio sp.]MBR4742188.1 type I DNA topoisomerase [Desulfovibrio sp.]